MSDPVKKVQIFGSKRRILLIAAGLAAGILLIAAGSGISGKSDSAASVKSEGAEIYYSDSLQKKLEIFLETVNGIDDVSVFVTLDGGSEYEYAKKGGGEGYAADYLIISGENGEEAAVVREIYPKIRGIAVTCTGGEGAVIKERVTSLLSAALGISANKIEVAGIG